MTPPRLPLSEKAEAALLIEKNHHIKKQRAYLEKLEAMSAQDFLECGLDIDLVDYPGLTQVLQRKDWQHLRYDAPNNHWYVMSGSYEKKVTGLEVAEALNTVRVGE